MVASRLLSSSLLAASFSFWFANQIGSAPLGGVKMRSRRLVMLTMASLQRSMLFSIGLRTQDRWATFTAFMIVS